VVWNQGYDYTIVYV